MLKFIDNILNKVTMYKLVLYVLELFLVIAVVLSAFGLLPFNPFALAFSVFFFVAVNWAANELSARFFWAPTNTESVFITALILALIVSPPTSPFDLSYFIMASWASVWAMASKYIFTIRKKHIFNPAAFAVALTALTINQSASWWIGSAVMLPAVLIGGLLIVKKIRRFDMAFMFLFAALVSIIGAGILKGSNLNILITKSLIETPLFFFAFVMFTEPLTAPQIRNERLIFATLVGVLFAPWVHIGSFYFTPEIALLVGNVFAYLVGSKDKFMLHLKERVEVASNTYDFVFTPDRPFKFKPGQYMEWTMAHESPDNRGNRRYFTIASSPTESDMRMGIKFYPKSSTFKEALISMSPTDVIVAAQLAGDFVMPTDTTKKLVFIAGGIGVTPFRSMIKYLVDEKEVRSVVLLYSNNTVGDIAYKDIFDEAQKKLGIKTVYTLTDAKSLPSNWKGATGFIDDKMIAKEVPDYKDSFFYLSGPHVAVVAFESALKKLGIPSSQIKKDFFPGFA
ncbi:MAG: oxidoreductase [Candidatus Uhrbacteria bacterium]